MNDDAPPLLAPVLAPVLAPALAAWAVIDRLHAAVTAAAATGLDQELAVGLPAFMVLRRLARAEQGSMRMHDLAACSPLTRSGLSRLVDRLEAAELVVRRDCPADRRGAFASLTPAGRATAVQGEQIYANAIIAVLGDQLDPTARERFVTALTGDPTYS